MSQHGSVRHDRFEIVGPLGQGGFGSVFEAIDWLSGDRVALKELNRVNAESLARFKKEYRALAGLHHPNLVGLNGLFEQDGRWYIVMELVPGSDLLTFVRGSHPSRQLKGQGGYDLQRLRTALRGMHAGLVALHGAGILHRDLKPSNVNVTPAGRAVLLDFGLITSTRQSRQSTLAGGIGTAAYMAPEQAMGEKVGPAADWYAFGACLFEALTGDLPYAETNALRMLVAKQSRPARRASELAEVPPDLDNLCAALLQRDPGLRPDGGVVAERLGIPLRDESETFSLRPTGASMGALSPCVGREQELRLLDCALERSRRDGLGVVVIEAERGMGKSLLARQFLRAARRQREGFLGLWGRCHEDDELAYRGIDGCMDELTRALRRRDLEAEAILPEAVPALAEQFPLLLGLPQVRRAVVGANPRGTGVAERRQLAFAALSELFHGLGTRRPLALVLDDLHFADASTFELLLALLDARPSPPLLIVATIRPRADVDAEARSSLETLLSRPRVERLELEKLTPECAEELAASLMGDGANRLEVRAVAEESGGHPLFVGELAAFARVPPDQRKVALTLESAVLARIHALGEGARALLEVAAVAGQPVAARVLAAALGTEDLDAVSRPLLAAGVLERRNGHELSFAHDLVRELVSVGISDARRDAIRRQLEQWGH